MGKTGFRWLGRRGGVVGNTSRLPCICTIREEKEQGARRVPRERVPECQESPKKDVEEMIDKEQAGPHVTLERRPKGMKPWLKHPESR